MLSFQIFIQILLISRLINGSILFWSTKDIQIPSLKYFNDDDFQTLLRDLENPEIMAFQNDFAFTQNIPVTPDNFYSVYIPNGNMYIENVTALTENPSENLILIKKITNSFATYKKQKNLLIVISSPNIRVKRDVNATDNLYLNEKDIKGPVLYSAKGNAMIYSSKPLILRTSGENYTLGYTPKVSMVRSPAFDSLAVTIDLSKPRKSITLKFKFQHSRGYWNLQTVQVDVGLGKLALLNTSKSIGAERNYSFHCFGETAFKSGDMELVLYEIQVEPNTKNGKFSTAYSCVSFTTVPIWSGLMVSFTLIIGLFIGLAALGSIKTMDKFDNSKTKQLSFTMSE